MKSGRMAIIAVALVSGLAAAYLSTGRQAAPAPQITVEPEKVPASEVLVAATDLPVGTKLLDANLKWLAWPAEGLSKGMILKNEFFRRHCPDRWFDRPGKLRRERTRQQG